MNSLFLMVRPVLLAIISFASPFQPTMEQTDYDPLASSGKVVVIEAEFSYGKDKRKVPLKIYLPKINKRAEEAQPKKSPVILFSHGLGGSRNNNPYLGNHWAGRGYVVVFMQHEGSDEDVWKDVGRLERLRKLKEAASLKSLEGRTADVPATLDQLEKWNKKGEKLAGRLDLKKTGLSGHSFGAVTTLALSGQNYGRRGQTYTDKRIKAAFAMSPSPPRFGNNAETFGKVTIPWMLMTGTKDKGMITSVTPEDRLKVFKQLPKTGNFYHLVLHDAEHMAFSERTLRGQPHLNPHYHKAILAMSSGFWDAHLKGDSKAKDWLKSDKAKKVLKPKDLWEMK